MIFEHDYYFSFKSCIKPIIEVLFDAGKNKLVCYFEI